MSQHINCVIIPEKPTEETPRIPDKFYCELCRLSRADPYVIPLFYLMRKTFILKISLAKFLVFAFKKNQNLKNHFCIFCSSQYYRFWDSVVHPLFPVKLTTTHIPTDG